MSNDILEQKPHMYTIKIIKQGYLYFQFDETEQPCMNIYNLECENNYIPIGAMQYA